MCAAPKVTRQGYYAWKRRPPSVHTMRDEELTELISRVRAEVRGIYGAPKAFFALRRMGVRTSMKRATKRESAEDLAKRNDPKGRVRHSDRRAQCVSLPLSRTMREHGVRPSMGTISSPWDNTAMESLMGIVKSECVHSHACATRDSFERIEVVYNRAMIHSALGCISPVHMSLRSESPIANLHDRKRSR